VKVFLDANILFSGSVVESRIAKLILVIRKHGSCVTHSYAVEEVMIVSPKLLAEEMIAKGMLKIQ
jgi:hypothetical protein